jgi:ABC-type amino acid transport substrate-binding protein
MGGGEAMKRCLGLTLILVVVMPVFLAGCSGKSGKVEKLTDLEGKTIGVQTLGSGISNDAFEKVIAANLGVKQKEVVYFNRLPDALAAVAAGKIDAVYAPSVVADYYLKRNNKIKLIASKRNQQFNAVMALRRDDVKLRDEINKAIATLERKGVLQELQEEWIVSLPANKEIKAKEIPKIPGARTVYIGVCGDLAPMDYITADGHPAGYNVALLTEIGKLSKINFEFVPLESQARLAALRSKKIDVIFIHLDSRSNSLLANEFNKNDWILTSPYFSFTGSSFVAKNE